MINNLFSVFDPSTLIIFNSSINWLRTLLGFIFIPLIFWIIPTRNLIILIKISLTLHIELKILINSKLNGITLIFISLFTLLLINNFLGLFPFVFTSSSHLVITLTLRLPLWLTFIIYGWITNTFYILVHLVPQGTPTVLISFIVCIELIRNIIRPITLAVRLSANIIAGHLLLTLLGNTGYILTSYILSVLLLTQILLLILERAVAIIQSYVFIVLSSLYSREVN